MDDRRAPGHQLLPKSSKKVCALAKFLCAAAVGFYSRLETPDSRRFVASSVLLMIVLILWHSIFMHRQSKVCGCVCIVGVRVCVRECRHSHFIVRHECCALLLCYAFVCIALRGKVFRIITSCDFTSQAKAKTQQHKQPATTTTITTAAAAKGKCEYSSRWAQCIWTKYLGTTLKAHLANNHLNDTRCKHCSWPTINLDISLNLNEALSF